MTIHILIADKLAPEGATFLKAQPNVEVIENTGLTGDELVQAVSAVEGGTKGGDAYLRFLQRAHLHTARATVYFR